MNTPIMTTAVHAVVRDCQERAGFCMNTAHVAISGFYL